MTSTQQSPSTTATYMQRPCPVCKADSPAKAEAVSSKPPAEALEFDALQQRWYGFFKDRVFFTYVRCGGCGLLYAPQYFSPVQLDHLYASMPANMAEVAHRALNKTQHGYFAHLQKSAALKGRFLEIGPDAGVFAEYCLTAGSFEHAWMIEPNVDVHDELKRRTQSTPTVISTSLDALDHVPDASVTVAAMIHVLDHLTDPLSFLTTLRKKLASDAAVLIVTHDERSLLARLLRSRWPAYCLQHPHLFNPRSIEATLRRCGFASVDVERSTNYFPMRFLAKHALLAAGVDSGNATSVLPRFEIPLRLGNMITIARVAD